MDSVKTAMLPWTGFRENGYASLDKAEQGGFARLLEMPVQRLREYLLQQSTVKEKEFIGVIAKIRTAAAD